jgi:hypothetical protein
VVGVVGAVDGYFREYGTLACSLYSLHSGHSSELGKSPKVFESLDKWPPGLRANLSCDFNLQYRVCKRSL